MSSQGHGSPRPRGRLEPERLADEVDALIRQQEQPFTTTSMWAQAYVYRTARDASFKIVLDGQGADETFAGYGVFRAARLEGLMRRGRVGEAATMLAALPAARASAMVQAAIGGLLPDAARGLARRAVGKPVLPPWLNAAWFGAAAVEHRARMADAHSPLAAGLRDAVMGSSLPMLLRYADRNAMAVSVENRVPYLTTDIVDFAFSLSDEILIAPDGTLKKVLRDALRGLVPDAILDRRDKIGFETPEAQWFARSARVRALATDTARLPLPPCFSAQVRDDIAALGSGQGTFAPHLWRSINVIRWSNRLGIDFGTRRQPAGSLRHEGAAACPRLPAVQRQRFGARGQARRVSDGQGSRGACPHWRGHAIPCRDACDDCSCATVSLPPPGGASRHRSSALGSRLGRRAAA